VNSPIECGLYDLDGVPTLQNRVFDSIEAAKQSPTGNLRIVQNQLTGLIYNKAFDPELLTYDSNYNNEQSLSPAFQAHLSNVKSVIARWLGKEGLLEVGCGKGYFLRLLREDDFDVLGCDPTYEGTEPGIIKDFYHSGLGITQKNIVLRHVLEHIPDPVGFLQVLNDVNGGGKIYVEVPCMDWIVKHRAWFDLFYEHVNYFRLNDLRAIFGNVSDCGHIFGGQYLYIVADLSSVRVPQKNPGDQFNLPADFRADFASIRAGVENVVWGAASKGVIYSLQARQAGYSLRFAVDVNPAKQGKYLPVTGIEVISPERALRELPQNTHVLIMNSNYRDEIIEMSQQQFTYTVVDNDQ
jgi:SAM-dependent methyltransferase